jgi:hypothetical protein
MIDPRDQLAAEELDALARVFREQLAACLEECARGRQGLFAEAVSNEGGWPEAARLRELALALQRVFSAHDERNALADEFLDLCSISEGGLIPGENSMRGKANPGERRLARALLERMERGEVGKPTEKSPWPG